MSDVHSGLRLKPAEDDHWQMGGGKATERFGGDLNPSGDWTASLPQNEAQSRGSFDTEGCVLFGTLKAYIMLAIYLAFPDLPKDASERYFGVWAGTNQYGTDPHFSAEQLRTVCGLIPQDVMPWTDDIDTFDEYYNKSMGQALLPLGSKLFDTYTFGNEWVFPYGSTLTPQQKQTALQAALKRGTVCVSISGDYRYNDGALTKNVGESDSHWVILYKHDGHGHIHDQYAPFLKTLDQNYDHNAAKVYFLKPVPSVTPKNDFWSSIWANFAKFRIWG